MYPALENKTTDTFIENVKQENNIQYDHGISILLDGNMNLIIGSQVVAQFGMYLYNQVNNDSNDLIGYDKMYIEDIIKILKLVRNGYERITVWGGINNFKEDSYQNINESLYQLFKILRNKCNNIVIVKNKFNGVRNFDKEQNLKALEKVEYANKIIDAYCKELKIKCIYAPKEFNKFTSLDGESYRDKEVVKDVYEKIR